ncbi:hypothetical protein C8R43DRAFT_985284 [Mycena crocata]|nr:hypothetical protein C8R43DRAFT_985284 [Mycena crocata]
MSPADDIVGPLPRLVAALGLAGIGIMSSVLLAFAYVAWRPTSRPHMNRVSLRLLIYALIANIIHTSLVLPAQDFSAPSAACTFVAFGLNTAVMFSTAMFFCVSLNLQLVLVHRVDGRKMEKYYVMGTCLLCLVCNITPLAAGQLGFLAAANICWFSNPNPTMVLRWAVGASSFWLFLMASGEIVSFVVLASFMAQSARNQSRATRVLSSATASSQQRRPTPPIVQYRGIIIRIGLYPLCSCLLNFSGCTLALYLANRPDPTPLYLRLNVVVSSIFAVRGCLYGLLGATDPSFLRAVRALWSRGSQQKTRSQLLSQSRSTHPSGATKAIQLEREADRPSEETRAASGDAGAREYKAEAHADPEQGISTQEDSRRVGKEDHEITCQF